MPPTLHCPRCSRPIPAADIDLPSGTAKCTGCDAVFRFADQLPAVTATEPMPMPMPKPRRFTVDERGEGLEIRWRWFQAGILVLLFFCVFWDGFLVFWYGMALHSRPIQWIMVFFPVIHVSVGVGLTYTVLCGLVESTTVTVVADRLSVRHSPLPWPGVADLEATAITRLRVVTMVGSRGSRSWRLMATGIDGTDRKLLGCDRGDEAVFLAQRLSAALKLPAPQLG